ncbi:MAG: hypothetical protein AAB517_01135 [Patescibacteria group bacterium]
MENQPIEQPAAQPSQQSDIPQMEQIVPGHSSSSKPVLYIVVAIVAIAALAYFFMMPKTTTESTTDSQAVTETSPALTEGNTTADISTDLNQLVGDSAGLDTDAAAVSGDLNSL